jgi:broad specificity phosphatase PhoE
LNGRSPRYLSDISSVQDFLVTRILIARHGHVDGIQPERFRGRIDLSLTPIGQSEARLMAERIAREHRLSAIYTSPMTRAVETATAVAKLTGLAPQVCQELNEFDYGSWEWKTFDEVKTEHPLLFGLWFSKPHVAHVPNGETSQLLVARAADMLRHVQDRHAGETILLVGHGTINRAILLTLLDQPLSAFWRIAQSPCGISEVLLNGNTPQVRSVNDTSHLAFLHLDSALAAAI